MLYASLKSSRQKLNRKSVNDNFTYEVGLHLGIFKMNMSLDFA